MDQNETILSEIKEEIDPMQMAEYIVQINDVKDYSDDCNLGLNQEKSAETVNKTHLSKLIESVNDEIKEFHCTICDYETKHKRQLKSHIESVHERIKPFKCSICEYKFGLQRRMSTRKFM